ncbi:hypothetical protein Trydic_g7063 [Trypoxylus dichotomus]
MRKDDNVLTCRAHPAVQNLRGKHTHSVRPPFAQKCSRYAGRKSGPSVFTDLCPASSRSSVPHARHTAMKASGKSRPQFT